MQELKDFRRMLGLNTTEMAKSIGISKSLYEKVEFAQRKASRNFVNKIKIAYPQIDTNIFFKN